MKEKTVNERIEHVLEYVRSGLSDKLPLAIDVQFIHKKHTLSYWGDITPDGAKIKWRSSGGEYIKEHGNDKVKTYLGCYLEEKKKLPTGGYIEDHLVVRMDMDT